MRKIGLCPRPGAAGSARLSVLVDLSPIARTGFIRDVSFRAKRTQELEPFRKIRWRWKVVRGPGNADVEYLAKAIGDDHFQRSIGNPGTRIADYGAEHQLCANRNVR